MHDTTEAHNENNAAASVTETSEVRYLDPRALRFFRHGAGLRLTITDEISVLSAVVIRMFPLSDPEGFFSIRDGDNKEVGVLVEPALLDGESRECVAEALVGRYLTPVVRRVVSVRERFGTVDWTVETDRGVRTFTTRNLRENAVQPANGRYLLTDVDGNRYDVPDLNALDAASQALLMRHL